eukprot:jgi/Ulvmu1/7847/UM004_0077.1
MGQQTEEERLLEEQLRRIAAARQGQQHHQYRDERSLQQMNQDQLDAIASPAQLYARQASVQDDFGRAQLPGSGLDAAELLRQMTQYPQGGVDRTHTNQLRGQHQLAISQPITDLGGLRQDNWTTAALQSLMSNITTQQHRAVVDHAARDPLQMQSQRLPARMGSPAAISHALQDLHSQSLVHAAMPSAQFDPSAHRRGPPTSSGSAWPDPMHDSSHIDSRHQPNSGLGRSTLSLPRGQPSPAGPSIDQDFSAALASIRPQVQSAQPTHSMSRDVQQTQQPPTLTLPQGKGTVLAAKVLTESDVKHSRAILPRVAVENNLPFLLGYRTFGIYIPDDTGTQWEFVVKSWANGRADKTGQTIKRKDRRVYVVEQMSKYLTKHRLSVGDIVGFVHVEGHLEVHCQTAALKTWIERPTYGPPPLAVYPTPVPGKCTLLDEQPGDTAARCQRTAGCRKPDHHLGPCEGPPAGSCMTSAMGAQKLKLWPQPDSQDPPAELADPSTLPELQPGDLLDGALVNFRVARSTLDVGTALMPSGHVIKVPEALADAPAMRLQVRVDNAGTYTIILAVSPRDEPQHTSGASAADAGPEAMGADATDAVASAAFAAAAGIDPATPAPVGAPLPAAGSARSWRILGLNEVLMAVHCSEADELCIEKEADSVLVHRLASTHLPPLPASTPTVTPPLPSTFSMNLCQRTQGCMKAENHTGFCSGHRGFKRKNTATLGSAGDEFGAAPRRRKSLLGTAKPRPGAMADMDWVPGRVPGGPLSDAGSRWRRDSRLPSESPISLPNLPNGSLGPSAADMPGQLPGNTGQGGLSHPMAAEQLTPGASGTGLSGSALHLRSQALHTDTSMQQLQGMTPMPERDLQLQLQQQQQHHHDQLLRQQLQEAQQQPQQQQQDMESSYLTMMLHRELWRQQNR